MMFVEMLTYWEPELFLLIISHSGAFVIIKLLIVVDRNIEGDPFQMSHTIRRTVLAVAVTAMFVSHALAPPRGHTAESPVNPPFTLHGHPSLSYSNKLLRDSYINFLYTTVYFYNISNGPLCTCICRLQSPRGLRHEISLSARTLGSWV
jgi:hypothetical protein